MKKDKVFSVNQLHMAVLLAIGSMAMMQTANATYKLGQGESIHIDINESINRTDYIDGHDEPDQDIEATQGTRDRSGDAVRIIWYGNSPQNSVINNGDIHGEIKFTGGKAAKNDNVADAWHNENASVASDGQGNGIDAYGWTSRNNKHDVNYTIDSIDNRGIITGLGSLNAGESIKKSYLFSNTSANGISLFSNTDFGSELSLAKGFAVSGGSGIRTRTTRSLRTKRSTLASMLLATSLDDANMHGKSIDIALNSLKNYGILSGDITLNGNTENKVSTDTEFVQYFPSIAYSSGNGASLLGYVYTADSYTYSDQKTNTAKLNSLMNTGVMSGHAQVRGGANLSPNVLGWSYVGTWDTANGLSVVTNTLRRAKHQTLAYVGDIINDGRITGSLQSTAQENNYVRNESTNNYLNIIKSSAEAEGSGNGINIHSRTDSASPSSATELKSLNNSGRISGSAELRSAKTGVDYIGVTAHGTGNGISAFLDIHGDTPKSTSHIGKIDNSGVISGSLYTKAGTTLETNKEGNGPLDHPDEEVKLLVSNRDFSVGSTGVDPRPAKPKGSYHYIENDDPWLFNPNKKTDERSYVVRNTDAKTSVFGSGDGIAVFSGSHSTTESGANPDIGDINNHGVVSGYSRMIYGYGADGYARAEFLGTGSGIAMNGAMGSTLSNSGIISGNQTALLAQGQISDAYGYGSNVQFKPGYYVKKGKNKTKIDINNYGLMAGILIVGSYDPSHSTTADQEQGYKYFGLEDVDGKDNPLKNHGTLVYLKQGVVKDPNHPGSYFSSAKGIRNSDSESVDKIVVADDSDQIIDGKTYHIINAPITDTDKDSELVADQSSYDNTVINGVGAEHATLIANQDLVLNNSTVNGFVHALGLNGAVNLTLDNTLINSNGFKVRLQDSSQDKQFKEVDPYAIIGDGQQDKTIILKNKTAINGDVALIGGNNTITIADNTVRLNGRSFDVGSGENTLILGDKIITPISDDDSSTIKLYQPFSGNLASLVINQPTVLHQKETGIRSVKNTVINSKLTYYGDYTMNEDDKLSVLVNGKDDNQHGQLHVIGGSVDISKGTLSINAQTLAKDAMVKGDKVLNIIKVEDVAVRHVVNDEPTDKDQDGETKHPYQVKGEFKSYTDNSKLFDFKPVYEKNAVHLEVTKADTESDQSDKGKQPDASKQPNKDQPKAKTSKIVDIVTNSDHNDLVDIARSIDIALDNSSTGAFAKKYWIPTTSQQVKEAVAQSAPLFTGGVGYIVADVVNQDRYALLHHVPSASNIQVDMIGGIVNQQGEHGRSGYQNKHQGIQISGNRELDNHTNIGALFSYNHSSANSRDIDAKHKAKINTFDVAGYISYPVTDRLTVDAGVGLAHSSVEGKRFIEFTGSEVIAKSNFGINTMYAGTGVSYRFGNDKHQIKPYIHTDVMSIKRDGYHETGADALNLIVDPHTHTGLNIEVGAKGIYEFNPKFSLYGQFGMAYDLAHKQAEATAVHEGGSTRKFSVYAVDRGHAQAIIGVGVSYRITPNATVSAQYQGMARKGSTNNNINVKLRLDF